MARLNDPSPGAISGNVLFLTDLLAALFYMRGIFSRPYAFQRRLTGVALVSAQMLRGFLCRDRPCHHNPVQYFLKLRHIVRVGPGHDYRQRETTLVYQKMAFAPFFFPGPWDCLLLPRAPEEPCSSRRQCSASSRQCPPSRRIRPVRISISSEILPPPPNPGNTGEWRWDSQISPWEAPSIGNPCAKRIQSLQTLAATLKVCARRRACGGMASRGFLPPWESGGPLSPKRRRTLPKTMSSAYRTS